MTSLSARAPLPASTTVLVTAFGPFPGVPVNATMGLVSTLGRLARTALPGVRVHAEVLATEWTSAPRRLEQLLAEIEPDLVLHFGVSSSARGFEIETRACNVRSLSPDAAGELPAAGVVSVKGAEHLRSTIPVAFLVRRLRAKGVPAFASRDAGQYLCNATLYHSLECARGAAGRRTGFIHVPSSLAWPGRASRAQSARCVLTWDQAVEGALEIVAGCLGRGPVAVRAVRKASANVL